MTSAEPAGGWPADFAGSYAKQRCLNYSRADVREWYSSQLAGLYKDGMSFWWNDEGKQPAWRGRADGPSSELNWWASGGTDALRWASSWEGEPSSLGSRGVGT